MLSKTRRNPAIRTPSTPNENAQDLIQDKNLLLFFGIGFTGAKDFLDSLLKVETRTGDRP